MLNTKNLHSINQKALSLFNSVIKQTESTPVLLKEYGVYLNKDSSYATHDVMEFLKANKLTGEELNKTFHKSWNKVLTASRLELLLHQLLHYVTGYGTNFTGNIYVPAEKVDLGGKEIPVYVVGALTQEELIEKSKKMLSSGIALKEETVSEILELLNLLGYKFTDVDWINNKEAKIRVIDSTNVFPKEPSEFLRYVVYKTVGETLLIKNTYLIDKIKSYKNDSHTESTLAHDLFNQYGLEKLATIFNRYKPIFLAYKINGLAKEKKTINKIAKLSKTMHKPMAQSPLNMVTHRELSKDDVEWLDKATGFALFRAVNACTFRMDGQEDFVYKIRNGKSWTTKNKSADQKVLKKNYLFLMNYIVKRFGKQFEGKSVYVPDYIHYGIPTSEKMFVGKMPMGTSIVSNDLVTGVYWHNDFGALDLDLSGIDASGNKYGWDSRYRNDSGTLAYSGDNTNAHNGAVEYLYFKGKDKNHMLLDTLVQVNCYSGNKAQHEYNVIVGIADEPTENYMLNPENLVLNERFKSTSAGSFTGVIHYLNDKLAFTLYPLCGSQARVSYFSTLSDIARNAFINEAVNGLKLNHLFAVLDVKMVETAEEADIDLSPEKIDKSTFIEMFS